MKMPAKEYHAVEALSQSVAKTLFYQSPAHAQMLKEAPKESKALTFGSAFHTLILEPDLLFDSVAVAPKVDKRTKAGKAEWAAFVEENEGKEIISNDELLTLTSMAEAVKQSASATALLRSSGPIEESVFFEWEGVKCKSRLDKCWGVAVVDLKSAKDASPDGFARDAFKYGYHFQGAWYLEAAKHLGMDAKQFGIVAVEKTAPFGVGVYTLPTEAIEIGRAECLKAIEIYKRCQESGEWPCYPDIPVELSVPAWVHFRAKNLGIKLEEKQVA